jgi:hypothetical protein
MYLHHGRAKVENQKPVYYVEKADETFQTSDRIEAEAMQAEWKRRNYPEVTITEIDPATAQEVTK